MRVLLEQTIEGIEPLSFNGIYANRRNGGSYMTDEGKRYKDRLREAIVESIIINNSGELPKLESGRCLRLTLEYGIDAYYKNGNPRKKDCSNFIKALEDSVAECIGIDDAHHWAIQSLKFDYKTHGFSGPVIYILLEEFSYSEVMKTSRFLARSSND